MGKFAKRSYQKEWMDDLEVDGEILKQTLTELRTINRFLGGNHVTTSGIQKLTSKNHQKSYSIADIGCGGGDMLKVLARWGKKMGLYAEFIGIDGNPHTIEAAKENLRDFPSVSLQHQNVFDPAFTQESVDIITCTLFTHHFTDEELIAMFRAFYTKANIGIVINDLHRHPLAYHSISWLTRLFSKSPMVKNDAPLSVQRSFKKPELVRILREAGISNFEIRWFWAFRWRIVIHK